MDEGTERQTAERERVEVKSEEVKNNFGEMMGRAAFGRERIVVTRFGKALVAIVALRDLEALEAFEDKERRAPKKMARAV